MNKRRSPWLQPTRRKRIALFLALDVAAVLTSLCLALWLRFDGQIPGVYTRALDWLLVLALVLKLPIFHIQGFYRMSWSHIGLSELIRVFKGVAYSSLLMGTSFFILRGTDLFSTFPRSVLILDAGLTLMLVGGGRLIKRVFLQWRRKPVRGLRTLIVGAGSAGEQLVRSLHKESASEHWPVGYVDDDGAKLGLVIHDLPVVGTCRDLVTLVKRHEIEAVFIAMPSATSVAIRAAVQAARLAGVKQIKVLPPLSQLLSGNVDAAQLREVNLEDLLGRSPVVIDVRAMNAFLREKRVLVTGAAGSIGAELCRQIARFEPHSLLMLDQDETGLFYLERELASRFPKLKQVPVIGNIQELQAMERTALDYGPHIVFHAAAYKHVDLMERFPIAAVRNNVLGTYAVARAAQKAGVRQFVLISTDKAVNPCSIMGASKRLAESVVLGLNRAAGNTRFMVVRFGNVLGSRGSVVPVFEAQIKQRGPVTITHPQMERYFMVTSEAVLLVLQAGAMGEGGEVFVLDMGQPVKIVDLARELIRLHGLEPDRDIPIVFTQPLPGEKLSEEVLTAEEDTQATKHERIYRARLKAMIPEAQLWAALEHFGRDEQMFSRERIIQWLGELVPEYRPATGGMPPSGKD